MKPGGHCSHCAEQENHHSGPAWRGCDEELVATGRREGGGQWDGGVILVQEEKSIGNGPCGGSAVKGNSTCTMRRGGESPRAGGEERLRMGLRARKSCSLVQGWQRLGPGTRW